MISEPCPAWFLFTTVRKLSLVKWRHRNSPGTCIAWTTSAINWYCSAPALARKRICGDATDHSVLSKVRSSGNLVTNFKFFKSTLKRLKCWSREVVNFLFHCVKRFLTTKTLLTVYEDYINNNNNNKKKMKKNIFYLIIFFFYYYLLSPLLLCPPSLSSSQRPTTNNNNQQQKHNNNNNNKTEEEFLLFFIFCFFNNY